MKNTSIYKAVELIGKEPLRDLLESVFGSMSRQMINKALRNGYAPPDWYELIQIATGEQVTVKELYDDCYKNKRNCKPLVVRAQANKFLNERSKSLHRVGKSRLRDKGVA